MKSRYTISLVMMIGSVLLFIGVTFAWLTYQIWVETGPTTHMIVNVDTITEGLEISSDGVTYDTTNALLTQNKVPGDVVFYRLSLGNSGNTDINIRVSFLGFLLFVNNELKDTSNFSNNNHLVNVIYLSAFNDVTSEVLSETLLVDLINPLPVNNDFSTSRVILFNSIPLEIGQVVNITFALKLSPNAGNHYQNLKLSIDSIIVDAIFE